MGSLGIGSWDLVAGSSVPDVWGIGIAGGKTAYSVYGEHEFIICEFVPLNGDPDAYFPNNRIYERDKGSLIWSFKGAYQASTANDGLAGFVTNPSSTSARLYIVGGSYNDGYTTEVYRSDVKWASYNAITGELGTSWTSSGSIPVALKNGACIVDSSGYVFLVGGYNSEWTVHGTATIYSAPVNGDGSVGTWVPHATLPRMVHGVHSQPLLFITSPKAGYSGPKRLWVMTRSVESTNVTYLSLYSSVITNGSLGAWTTHKDLLESSNIDALPVGNAYFPSHANVVTDHITGERALLVSSNTGLWSFPIDNYGTVGEKSATAIAIHPLGRIGTIGSVAQTGLTAPKAMLAGGTNSATDVYTSSVYSATLIFGEIVTMQPPGAVVTAGVVTGVGLQSSGVTLQPPGATITVDVGKSVTLEPPGASIEAIGIMGQSASAEMNPIGATLESTVIIYEIVTVDVEMSPAGAEISADAKPGTLAVVTLEPSGASIEATGLLGNSVTVILEPDAATLSSTVIYSTPESPVLAFGVDFTSGTLCVNAENSATTQFMNFDYTSYAEVGGLVLATGKNGGLYSVAAGDLDGENEIDAFFTLPSSDLGVNNAKRLRFVHLGYESSGSLKFSMAFDNKTPFESTIPPRKEGLQRGKFSITRSESGRYLTSAKFENIDGCDFYFDDIEALPIILHSGRQ